MCRGKVTDTTCIGTQGIQMCDPTGPVGGGDELLGTKGSDAGGLMNRDIPPTSYSP